MPSRWAALSPRTPRSIPSHRRRSASPPPRRDRLPSTAEPLHDTLNVRKAVFDRLPTKRAKKPTAENSIQPSPLRPHVPADRRLLMWTTPYSLATHREFAQAGIPAHLQVRFFESLAGVHVENTQESYAAGLMRFTQFCDRLEIDETARMPANRALLAAFVAEATGNCSGKCVRNWLNGLHLWHTYNGAPWYGDDTWLSALKRSADRAGMKFKRPPRGPITPEHLRALRATLDLNTPSDAALWAVALTCFRGCRRLGEMVLKSLSSFSNLYNTSRSTRIVFDTTNGRETCSIHIVWTKTTTTDGGECILTQVLGPDADLCPVWAFRNHQRVNHSPPPNTPLFAHRTATKWRPITKDFFLKTSSAAYRNAQLDLVFGHSYRIGGSLDLLTAGVAPEYIMKLGGWTSLCFLIYWRRLQLIVPLAITRAWDKRIRDFASTHGHSAQANELSFDR